MTERVTIDDLGDHVCEHGTAMDVHCCGDGGRPYPGCHSGFVFDIDACKCSLAALPETAVTRTPAQWAKACADAIDLIGRVNRGADLATEIAEALMLARQASVPPPAQRLVDLRPGTPPLFTADLDSDEAVPPVLREQDRYDRLVKIDTEADASPSQPGTPRDETTPEDDLARTGELTEGPTPQHAPTDTKG